MSAEIQKGIEVLIGRPLLDIEAENFNIYYDLAKSKLNNILGGEVFVSWESADIDLRSLLARVFAINMRNVSSNEVESKSIDGFSVKMRGSGQVWADFITQNAEVIAKYRINIRAKMRSGETIYDRF